MATARHWLMRGPQIEVGIEYNDANGRGNGVYCVNSQGVPALVVATMTDGTTYQQVFEVGDTSLDVPGGRLRVDGLDTNDHSLGELVGLAVG